MRQPSHPSHSIAVPPQVIAVQGSIVESVFPDITEPETLPNTVILTSKNDLTGLYSQVAQNFLPTD
jgi:hypothetical protein